MVRMNTGEENGSAKEPRKQNEKLNCWGVTKTKGRESERAGGLVGGDSGEESLKDVFSKVVAEAVEVGKKMVGRSLSPQTKGKDGESCMLGSGRKPSGRRPGPRRIRVPQTIASYFERPPALRPQITA